jgi:hypothetical protein
MCSQRVCSSCETTPSTQLRQSASKLHRHLSPNPLSKQCARCGAESKRACKGCKDPPIFPKCSIKSVCIYYCSPKCQEADWESHKRLCKNVQTRKYLCKSRVLLQEIFYIYREIVFDNLILKIEKRGDGKMYLHGGPYYTSLESQFDILAKFPSDLCENERDKQAILAYLACNEASAWMYEMIRYFLLGEYLPRWHYVPL